jgi:hypothetical protein
MGQDQTNRCGIHQPNFFPWMGYFSKMTQSDYYVILDDVQFTKTGGSYTNRVQFCLNGKVDWLTGPVVRGEGVQKINETFYQSSKWKIKMRKSLEQAYSKAPYFKENKDWVFNLIEYSENNVSAYNVNAVIKISEYLNIETSKFLMASAYNLKSKSTQRLIDLSKHAGCSTYIVGGGGDKYQDYDLFDACDIKPVKQNFKPIAYAQFGREDFVPGLSIIDAIFNVDRASLIKMVHNNV